MTEQGEILRAEGLVKRFGGLTAVNGVSFSVRKGEIFGIIGRAGSGNTSLLRALNRTLELTPGAKVKGHIKLDGDDVYRMGDVARLRRRIGMVAPLPVGLTLLQNNDGITNWGPVMAGTVLAMLPVLVLFLVLQRQMIKGLTAGAVKS